MMCTKPQIQTVGNCAKAIQLIGKVGGDFEASDPIRPEVPAYDLDE